MIEVLNKTTVSEAVIELLTALTDQNILTTLSINGVVGASLDSTFRYGAFEFTGDVLSDTQKVRFRFDVTEYSCASFVGTDICIDDTGTVSSDVVDIEANVVTGQMVSSGGKYPWYEYIPPSPDADAKPSEEAGQLFNVYASITDHGLAICCYEQTSVISGTGFSWFVVQRPINPDGTPYVEDRAPVVCLYGSVPDLENQHNVQFCVVREFDVNVPTVFMDASVNHDERVAVINIRDQVAIAPSRRACIFFPSEFNTQRYYYALELDMFAYTSADVISMSSIVPDDRYGKVREYVAFNANKAFNQGMRFLFYSGEK